MDLSKIIYALSKGHKNDLKKFKATLESQLENKTLKALGTQYASVPKMFKESLGKCNHAMIETYIKYGDKFLFTNGGVMMILNKDLGYTENTCYTNRDSKCFTPYGTADEVAITKQSVSKIKKNDYVYFTTKSGREIKMVKRFADYLINFSDKETFFIGRTPMSGKTDLDVVYQCNDDGEVILVRVMEK